MWVCSCKKVSERHDCEVIVPRVRGVIARSREQILNFPVPSWCFPICLDQGGGIQSDLHTARILTMLAGRAKQLGCLRGREFLSGSCLGCKDF